MADLDDEMANITCPMGPLRKAIWKNVFIITYYALTPAYFCIGLFGHALLLLAFKRQSQKESAYVYQILMVISKTIEVISFSIFITSIKLWLHGESQGIDWFRRSYFLNFLTIFILTPISSGFMTISLLFSLAMAADRVTALTSPYKYKNLNHKRNQIWTVIICVSAGLLISCVEGFSFYPGPDTDRGDGYWYVAVDWDVILSISTLGVVANTLRYLRSAVRTVGVLALIVINIIMLVIFRKRSKKVATMVKSEQKDQARKAADKTLLQLTIWQSVLTCLAHIPHAAYFYLGTGMTDGWMGVGCWGMLLSPYVDACVAMAESMDIFVVFMINKRTRKMISDVFPGWCRRLCSQEGHGGTQAVNSVNSNRSNNQPHAESVRHN